jgi:hypothetical protein
MTRIFPRRTKGHPEDAAIRIALREIARDALALENMLGEGLLWGDERRKVYVKTVERARAIGKMQWPDEDRT